MLTNLQKAALAAEFRNLDATLAAEYIIRLGLDPGFGNFKIALAVWGKILVDYIASMVGIGKTDLGLLDNLPGGRSKRLAKPDVVEFGGVTYLTGNNVHRFTRRISQRLDFERLADGPELRALLYTVLGRLLGGGQHQVAFMVGLPVEIIQNRDLAQQMLGQLQGWLVGTHNFTVNGQAMTVTVTAVKVIAQPAGAYFSWCLDPSGQWTQTKEVLKSPVAVVDGGYNTIDLYTLKDGNIDLRYVGGEKLGMRRANELLRANVQETYGVDLTLDEADELMREYLDGRTPQVYHAGGVADVNPLTRQAIDSTFASVINFIEERLGNGRQFPHLLFTGGQMQALKKPLTRHYPHGLFLPITANAEGLAKFAQRSGIFD